MTENEETTLGEIRDRLDQNQQLLREIARWLRFQNIGKLKEVLTAELDSDEKKLAFDKTDDTRGIDEIAEISHTPRDTVYGWWKKWFRMGILENSERRKGRLVKICSLEDVGIRTPKAVDIKDKPPATKGTASEETVENGRSQQNTKE